MSLVIALRLNRFDDTIPYLAIDILRLDVDHVVENSPIHFADKVRTPVLILHNDQDGAVPWTQGIEYFTALRRLGKEAYLFNYTGEDHGLRKRQNMKDWSRRMAEYFDSL